MGWNTGGRLATSDGFYNRVKKTITFDGATENAIGDFDGTGEPHTIFTLTGVVVIKVIAVCTTTLTIDATATLEVGVSGDTATIIAQEAGDAIDANEIWHDTTCDSSIELLSVAADRIITNGQDIIGTTATANINTGVIDYTALWYPISADGNVVAG